MAGSDYKAVVGIRYKGSMNTTSERLPSRGNHLPLAGMPAFVTASQAFRLGRFPFPA